ncbi:fluoride efflux transporter CrcB [Shimia sp. R9_3]|uniref:fluoride efflux transporter CrcB n=1 Tax=Shimia sp. R9_3 TaxID=2821113 RepID=UPI001ADCFC55|nr:fluoride efflux transporter CrcB [Shimia sp. R9_3]MBO9401134.1 fluoride efflux transporter CrcB [Shimia sp. R9_3]
MILNLTYVAVGGAIGAALRYLVGLGVVRLVGQGFWNGFPLAIITVNVIGSFLMGAFVVVAAQRGLTHYSPLVMTGLLGGFTTFSAFSLETVTLVERGDYGAAAIYVAVSVIGAVGALMLGMILTRGLLA